MQIKNTFSFKTVLLFFLAGSRAVTAQTPAVVPFDSLHWHMEAKAVTRENYAGKECIKITDGAAYLNDNFETGVIEFDISFDKERCFPGLMFRIIDNKNFEFLYLRPHQSGNPDAIQYCPIIFGNDSWQLYTGYGYCAQADFVFDGWIHVKVIISKKQAELYLNNESSPTLFMHELQREPVSGGLALDNHSPASVRFADFSYIKEDNPAIKSPARLSPLPTIGLIKKWQVSGAFPEKEISGALVLSPDLIKGLQWDTMETEDLGFINIGKHIRKTPEKNTVFAKFTLRSDKEQIKQMSLGFSDRCKVYLNGKLLYGGSNTFKSRDYRFYGTIGFWDDIYLDLKKGDNEIMIAVAEDFGGWGVEARLNDLNDITISL